MQFSLSLAALVLGFTSLAIGTPHPLENEGPNGVYTSPPPASAYLPWATAAPTKTVNGPPNKAIPAVQDVTIQIRNAASIPVSIAYTHYTGGPGFNGNPGPGSLAPAATTAVSAPPGWVGTIFVGNNFNPNGSVIEANLVGQYPNIDVSYVSGYSVPIVCGCGQGSLVTGCNKPLFKLNSCPNELPGPVCLNPERTVNNGPASPFFQPCAHAAITYPYDKGDAQCGDAFTLNCCIGPECNPSVLQSP